MERLLQARTVLDTVIRLADEGLELTRRIAAGESDPEAWIRLLDHTARRVTALDEQVFHLELAHAWLRPLAVLFRFDKDELEQEPDLLRTNRAMGAIYRTLAERARVLDSLLEATAALLPDRLPGMWHETRGEACHV